MRLLLDVGNTAVKWATASGDELCLRGQFLHAADAIDAQAQTAWSGIGRPAAVVVASVAGGEINQQLSDWLAAQWQCPVRFVSSTAQACGVRNAYDVPGELGIDRWAAVIGAHAVVAGDACVVDCGTAITVDLVGADGQHGGGMILPGVTTLRAALADSAANIDAGKASWPASPLSTDTGSAVASGALYIAAAAIDRIVADIGRTTGGTLQACMTGGDAPLLMPLLQCSHEHMPDLVLQGLASMCRGEEQ